jgi:hypothetical protein
MKIYWKIRNNKIIGYKLNWRLESSLIVNRISFFCGGIMEKEFSNTGISNIEEVKQFMANEFEKIWVNDLGFEV